jgi:hypothetical protein
MVKTETQQRIAQQAVGFDSVMAGFADTEGARVQPGKSGVYAGEKLMKRGVVRISACGCKQALAAQLEFCVEVRIFRGGHGSLDNTLLLSG